MVLGGGLGLKRPAAIFRVSGGLVLPALGVHLRTLRATLLSAALTAPLALGSAIPTRADGLSAPSPLLVALDAPAFSAARRAQRSEERRVGKECRSRWS